MKGKQASAWILALAGLLVFAGAASAFELGNVDGLWAIPDTNGATCDRWATGPGGSPTNVSDSNPFIQSPPTDDENQVRYGIDLAAADCVSTAFNVQSGFGFDGNNNPGTPALGQPFYLGDFVHYNYPIDFTNPFDGVDLTVTIPILCNDGSPPTEGSPGAFVYRFTLDETFNGVPLEQCAYPGTTPCPDRVTVDQVPDQVFTCDEGQYTVAVLGFTTEGLDGQDCSQSFNVGSLTNEYITEENALNEACLWAQIDFTPTPVDLVSLSATAEEGAIVVRWQTGNEIDNLGFNLYRGEWLDGPRTMLNEGLIPGQSAGSPAGGSYEFADTAVESAVRYYYWLEDIDRYGRSTVHEPVTAQLGFRDIELPVVNP
jgi:hypothetical protein